MSVAQWLFVSAMTVVVLAIVAFMGVVVAAARRSDGGSYLARGFVRRMTRPGVDRGELNGLAFYAHRISGAAIFAFLCLHIVDVSLYSFSHSLFNNVHGLYGTEPMRVFECALLFAIAFHTANGLRLMVVDLADVGRAAATRALAGVTAFTVLAGLAGSVIILRPGLA
ncbi:MAG TPA: succinate dehydrogenase, cytochrome b556 subunit [Streptosporangiaceae bacterium]|nr:succinate dehydrogenase, cytochrome b556 subunit [Streptosporangiaceae bacterium]